MEDRLNVGGTEMSLREVRQRQIMRRTVDSCRGGAPAATGGAKNTRGTETQEGGKREGKKKSEEAETERLVKRRADRAVAVRARKQAAARLKRKGNAAK